LPNAYVLLYTTIQSILAGDLGMTSQAAASPAFLIVTTFVLSAPGCKLAAMKLPVELRQSSPMEVSKSGGMFDEPKLSFGAWSTPIVSRGRTHRGKTRLGTATTEEAEQAYSFSLARGRIVRFSVSCAVNLRDNHQEVLGVEVGAIEQPLTCEIASGDRAERLGHMRVEMTEDYVGDVQVGRISFDVRAERQADTGGFKASEPFGFVLTEPDGGAAAVQVINTNSVWMSADLDEPTRDVAAAAMAALMLFENLEEK
jgi:hypothetical protein